MLLWIKTSSNKSAITVVELAMADPAALVAEDHIRHPTWDGAPLAVPRYLVDSMLMSLNLWNMTLL